MQYSRIEMKEFNEILPFSKWFEDIETNHFLIAGPCAAESETQLLSTADALKKTGNVHFFRTGVWKPRTRPQNFEGVGEEGLKWLQKVKQETGLRTAVEVASPEHVHKVLKYKVDLVWIGARTTSNPFSVQELANHLKGTDMPVLIKNPVNPDLNMWIGAIERFYNAGLRKIAAVHRGFYPFEATKFRNIPKWEIPIELKTLYHYLPIICDPSHIAGCPEYLREISQKALDLNMNGLMIEVHPKPSEALSDARQQITPGVFEDLISNLEFRSINSDNPLFLGHMDSLREKIDSVDKQIIELLAQRMNYVEEIGKYKLHNKVTIFQRRRWERILSSRKKLGKKLGLSEQFIKKLLQLVHKESISKQTEIMNRNKDEDENTY